MNDPYPPLSNALVGRVDKPETIEQQLERLSFSSNYHKFHSTIFSNRWFALAEQVYGKKHCETYPVIYSTQEIDEFLKMIERHEPFFYHMTDRWLWQALEKYSIKDQQVAVMGSMSAWYESNVIYFGGHPITVDYNERIITDPRIGYVSQENFNQNIWNFDSAISISSFEHSGLGFYGEKVEPDADLHAMHRMKQVIKRDGLLFLAVPIGKDNINGCDRVYGRERFPRLTVNWKILDSFGMDYVAGTELWDTDGQVQPVFVLQNV